MKIKNASAGALTNFEVLNFFRSRGASKEVAVTIAPSEYKVFEYLIGTAASHQTIESISVLLDKVKTYDLAKSEVLNIVNLRPTLPVGLYTVADEDTENYLHGFADWQNLPSLPLQVWHMSYVSICCLLAGSYFLEIQRS